MSTDDRLKALYRAATARGTPAAPVQDDDIAQALQRAGWPDEDGTPLDRIAGSAAHADILRTVLQLGPEAQALSRDIDAARRPVVVPMRRPGAMRSVMALAAGVGAAALLIAGLGQLPVPEAPLAPSGSDVILSASFESDGHDRMPSEPDANAIFNGGFDS